VSVKKGQYITAVIVLPPLGLYSTDWCVVKVESILSFVLVGGAFVRGLWTKDKIFLVP